MPIDLYALILVGPTSLQDSITRDSIEMLDEIASVVIAAEAARADGSVISSETLRSQLRFVTQNADFITQLYGGDFSGNTEV